jgi:hypothetical protein
MDTAFYGYRFDAVSGKDHWDIGVVPPGRSVRDSYRKTIKIVDEAAGLEHDVNITGPRRIVVVSDRTDQRVLRRGSAFDSGAWYCVGNVGKGD